MLFWKRKKIKAFDRNICEQTQFLYRIGLIPTLTSFAGLNQNRLLDVSHFDDSGSRINLFKQFLIGIYL